MRREGRVLGLAIDDELPERRREHPPILLLGLAEVREQTRHTVRIESVRLPVECSRRGAGLLRPLPSRAAEEHDGPNQLIENLLRPLEKEPELLPIVGGGNTLAF